MAHDKGIRDVSKVDQVMDLLDTSWHHDTIARIDKVVQQQLNFIASTSVHNCHRQGNATQSTSSFGTWQPQQQHTYEAATN